MILVKNEEIDRKDGMVDMCYYFGAHRCNKNTFEDCQACHRGAARSKEAKTGK